MSDEIKLNAAALDDMFYFGIESNGTTIIIECNKCSTGDYVFSRETAPTAGAKDWLIKAATHFNNHHRYVLR